MGGDRVAAFRQESFVVAPSPLVARIFCVLSFLPGKKVKKIPGEKKLKCQIEIFLALGFLGIFRGRKACFFYPAAFWGRKSGKRGRRRFVLRHLL